MAGQVAQQLCPDAGRLPLLWPDSPKTWGVWQRALRAGLRLGHAETAAGMAFVDPGGQSGGALSPGVHLLAPEPAGGTRLQTTAPQAGVGREESRGLALCRQRRPRGRLQQAHGGHPLLTDVRDGRVLCKQHHLWCGMLAHWAQLEAARRLFARYVVAAVLAPAALFWLGAA